MLSDADLDDLESKLKWLEKIDHGEALEFGRKLTALLAEARKSRDELSRCRSALVRIMDYDARDGEPVGAAEAQMSRIAAEALAPATTTTSGFKAS